MDSYRPNNEDVTNLSPWEIQREELEDEPQGREEIPPEGMPPKRLLALS